MKLRIKRFDPDTLKPHRIILVVGKRGTGKSVLQRDLMYHMREKVDFGLAFSPTEETQEMFREHMPDSWIYNGFSQAKLDAMLHTQRELCKDKKQRNLFIIMDDCMYDKKILKGLGIRDLFMNGRHMHITLCNAVQYVMDIGPDLRTQVDYVFALRENIISNKSKLWKYFFGMFEKYDDFAKVMDKCTSDHGALVMDNTTGSCNIEDCIYWYRAEYNLPNFRFGSKKFHDLSAKYIKSEHDRKMEELEQKEMEKMVHESKQKKRISCVQMEDEKGNVLLENGLIKLS